MVNDKWSSPETEHTNARVWSTINDQVIDTWRAPTLNFSTLLLGPSFQAISNILGNVEENQSFLNSSYSECLIFCCWLHFYFANYLCKLIQFSFNISTRCFSILRDRDYWTKLFYKEKGKFLSFDLLFSTAPVLNNQVPHNLVII